MKFVYGQSELYLWRWTKQSCPVVSDFSLSKHLFRKPRNNVAKWLELNQGGPGWKLHMLWLSALTPIVEEWLCVNVLIHLTWLYGGSSHSQFYTLTPKCKYFKYKLSLKIYLKFWLKVIILLTVFLWVYICLQIFFVICTLLCIFPYVFIKDALKMNFVLLVTKVNIFITNFS